MRNNLGLVLAKRAFLNPDREAYVDSHRDLRLTYAELNERCNQLANALLDGGIEPGERVGLLLMNSAEFMEAYFALAKAGAVVVPLNWRLVADELEFILKDSGTRRLIFGDEFIDTVAELHGRGDRTDVRQWLQVAGTEELAHFAEAYETFRDRGARLEPEPVGADEDMLYIMYTSGTTGLPKGVVHTHSSALWAVITIAATVDYQDGDRYLAALPMFHVGALTPLAVNVYRGATSVVMRSFDPTLAWQLIERERITTGLMVPAMLNFMLQVEGRERFDYATVRWIMTGAAPVPVALTQRYADMGIGVLQVYGLTESCGPACVMDSANALQRPDSTGKAFFHTEVRVVDEQGEPCAPGEAGEVVVRGAHIMREYWNRPDATAETLKNGWLHTGDVAVMDEAGFVAIQDRMKDMIISGGENVYPAEIEGVLSAHPKIVEAAVIGRASEKWGESPLAIVVRNDDALSEAEVMQFCEGKLARFKRPHGVVFVDEIPRNPSGKILKRVLREQFPDPAGA
ncbi:MAG: long-chain-fatty-acid--CoA ligase [Gammaproteobacteria bacterium]|nr:long-chain-fatty-acid--CoA ligase [Gammaproteobacteria bacterium]